MTSEIRTNSLKSRAGLSTVTLTDSGPIFSGITTFVDNSTFSVGTGGTIHAPATNTLNIGVNNTESLRIDSNSNLKVAGIVTATSFKLPDGSSVGGVESDSSNNTLGGTNAGDSITSGDNNTFFGYNAGTDITDAQFNTFIGSGAGSNTNSGTYLNTFIGYNAGVNNGNGHHNIFIGASAGAQNAAWDNIFIGNYSGDANTSGTQNVFVGKYSGTSNQSGSHNSCLGQESGNDITSGSSNTCIGHKAGNTGTNDLTEGSNNILIGHDAAATSATVSNEITLGDSNITKFRIPGLNFTNDNGRLLIGTTSQNNNAKLQVTTDQQVVATFEGTGASDPQIYLGDNMASPTDNCFILGYDKADNRGYLTVGGDADTVFTVANGGAIGINNNNPQRRLHIGSSGTAEANIRLQGGSDYSEIRVKDSDDSLSFHVNMNSSGSVEKLKLTQSDATLNGTTDGVLNINTSDSRGSFIRFQQAGATEAWVGCGQGLSLGGKTTLAFRSDADIRIRTGAEEHATITTDGCLAVKGAAGNWIYGNHPANYQGFHQFSSSKNGDWMMQFRQEHHNGLGFNMRVNNNNANEAIALYRENQSNYGFKVYNTGNVQNINNSYGSLSDVSLKENIVDAKSQWDDIKAIKVRNFNLKSDTDKVKMLGVVAQELETVSPHLVFEDKDSVKGVHYSILYMKAIKALQESQARIEKLEEDNIALRVRVTNLEGN